MTNQTMPLTQEQISQYHNDGYLIVPNVFDLGELEPLQKACKNDPKLWEEETEYVYSNQKTNRVMFYHTLSDSLLGVMPRVARIVNAAESLLGEECYHFHSKLVRKEAYNQGNVDWHQGYGTWYHYGCLFPTQITCAMAITENTKANGCMQVVKKSHQMGRLNHLQVGDTDAADPERMQEVLKQLEVVDCEMQAGDVLFFHANTLHASTPNNTDKIRVILHSTYSTISGQPYKKDWQHHAYKPLEKLPDSVIKESRYNGIINHNDFFQSENQEDKASGLVFRGFQEAQ